MMSRHLAFIWLVAALGSAVELEDTQYLITSPEEYRPAQEETIGVHLFGSKSCKVEVRVKNQERSIIAQANGTFNPDEPGKLKITIPKDEIQHHRYYYRSYFDLDATVCGVKTKSITVFGRRQHQSALNNLYIQTDKPIYKPGQKIRIRILSVDNDLKPKDDKPLETVHVVASASRIKQWDNVELRDGIASLELQLSKEPVLGDYVITASGYGIKKTLTIVVDKYVLPKFEVKIQPPAYMALDQKEFTTSICAKYTYGKNVKGMLNAVLCLSHRGYYYHRSLSWEYRRNNFETCQNITKEIDGCTDITLSRESLNVGSITNTWSTNFKIVAKVNETLTGVTFENKITTHDFRRRSIQMSFQDTSSKFKPGLPFKYVLKVTRPDGSLVTGAHIRVKISRDYYDNFYDKTFVVKDGLITGPIDDNAYNNQPLIFDAELLDKNPYPTKSRKYPVRSSFRSNPWYSPSFSYLEISETQKAPAKIGSEGSLAVRYTVRNDTGKEVKFHYTVMCKRNIVLSGTHMQHHDYLQEEIPATTVETTTPTPLSPTLKSNKTNATLPPIYPVWRWWLPKPEKVKKLHTKPIVEKFDIKFPVTMEMVPSCRIMVYYVRDDKEVVADSVKFDVEDRLENQVSVSFEDEERKPGEKTNLILKASPGSRVAFVAVDKSIHLLKAGNELNMDTIRPMLRSQEVYRAWNSNSKCRNSRRWYPWWRTKRDIMPSWGGYGSDYDDASEAFNVAGVLFISNLSIFTKPCPIPSLAYEMLLTDDGASLGDAGPPGADGREGDRGPIKETNQATKAVRVRKEFPETWLWADEKIDKSGNKKIQVTVPDTITTWVANGFAMSSTAGLGIAETASIKAFQPFFVQMTLPYSVIRGEEIPVIVTVFNYMRSCVPVKLQLKPKSRDYKVTSYHINKLCVCGDSGKSIKFTIIPAKLGHIPLTVTATPSSSTDLCPSSTVAGQDAVTRKLLVEPEGIRKEYTQGTFFCPKDGEYTEEFDLRLPKDIVPGSVYPTVTIIGDIMGPAMNNLEDLLRMPYGCGEQNMANFAPNIYIMDYLTKTHQATGDIKQKAENFMDIGYQRELNYKRKSGSYSAFGNGDAKGSMMLTAFVVRSFARAKKYIFVDDEHVAHSLLWFSKKQKRNGCFPQYGKLFNRGLQGGVNSELTITAYVTTALLEAGESPHNSMVSHALSCITSQLNSINDSYTMALVTYTLSLANHTDAPRMLALLRKRAIKKSDLMHWANENKKPEPRYYWYYYRSSAEVEMTGYALLAILHQSESDKTVTDEVMDIIRWLSKQRNSYGGFASTQDTCVALQALAEFAGKAYGDNADFRSSQLKGSLKMGNYYNHDFLITKQNKLTLQTVELPPKVIPGKLQLSGRGVGCALIQASVKYNVPEPEEVPAFDIKVHVRTRRSAPNEEATRCSPLRLDITAKWLKEDVSNMAVVDVKLVTGFSVREESLENLRNDPLLNFKRYDIDGQNVMLYFDEIKDMTFSIDIHQDMLAKKLKPAVVKVYDYYEPESQAKVMYKIGEAECYGNKIDAECPKCMTLENPDPLIRAIVACNSTVTRMRARKGMLKVVKAYSTTNTKTMLKKELEYQIEDFCPCEEIYDSERALVIGQNSYFKVDGKKTTIVLNSGTTILKWKGKSMKKHIKMIRKKLVACKGKQ